MTDTIYKCTKTLLIDEKNDVVQINVGSTWLLVPTSPEGHDVAIEDNDNEGSATQIWLSFSVLDEHFQEMGN